MSYSFNFQQNSTMVTAIAAFRIELISREFSSGNLSPQSMEFFWKSLSTAKEKKINKEKHKDNFMIAL